MIRVVAVVFTAAFLTAGPGNSFGAQPRAVAAGRPNSPHEARHGGAPPRQAAGLPVESILAASGAGLDAAASGLTVLYVLPDSPFGRLGLKAGDSLLFLNGRRTRKPSEAARAVLTWKSGTRLSAIVSRPPSAAFPAADLRGPLTSLETGLSGPLAMDGPGRDSPSPRVEKLRDNQLALARRAAEGSKSGPRSPGFRVKTGGRFWVRFPKGVPASVREGDIIEGETSTAMATSSKLDFIAIPQGSRVRAVVASVDHKGPVKLVRLHAFRIGLNGGHEYPCSAAISDLSGDRDRLRVGGGGTIVAAPAEDERDLISSDRNVQFRLLEPLTIFEPSAFYAAGPGLWFRTIGDGKGRAFEVTHVIPWRSAHRAGIAKGDRIYYVGSSPTYRLDFSEGIRGIYGKPGSEVELRLMKAGATRLERVKLIRGVVYQKGFGLKMRSGPHSSIIKAVEPGSPAELAGLHAGDALVAVDGAELGPRSDASSILRRARRAGSALLTYRAPGRTKKDAKVSVGYYPAPLRVGLKNY